MQPKLAWDLGRRLTESVQLQADQIAAAAWTGGAIPSFQYISTARRGGYPIRLSTATPVRRHERDGASAVRVSGTGGRYMRLAVTRRHWPILVLVCAFKVEAQTPRRGVQAIGWSWGLVGAGYALTHVRSETPRAAIGMTASASHQVGSLIAVRATGSFWASLPAGDPVSICYLLPGGGCAPAPIVPEQLWFTDLNVLVRVFPRAPLLLVGGAGAVLPVGDRADSLPSLRPAWRWGVEVGDGKRWRGVRVQFTHIGFNRLQDLTGAQSIAILF